MPKEENRYLVRKKEKGQSLEKEFTLFLNHGRLPVDACSSDLDQTIVGICFSGSAVIAVHDRKYVLTADGLIFLFPYQLVRVIDTTPDFSISFFTISPALFFDILSGICRFSPRFFLYMQEHCLYPLPEREVDRFIYYLQWIEDRINSPRNLYKRESLIHLLRILFLDLYNKYMNDQQLSRKIPESRKEEIAYQFLHLIMLHCKERRDVAFYADKLCITPKYLTMAVKEISGKSAKEWITNYILLEIKGLLRDSQLSVQEIVTQTSFLNQSSLGRFFREHTGMSPLQYRKNR